MNRFELITPTGLRSASRLLSEKGNIALGGGIDVIDLLVQGLAAPNAIVNLKGLKELNGIETRPDGSLKIGAAVKLAELAEHPELGERFAAIAMAAAATATPQIRNQATVAGNLLQRPRCWYFRNPEIRCLKKGGGKCYAIAGLNRHHAILGGGPVFIVHPSTLAVALVAFGASAKIFSAGPSVSSKPAKGAGATAGERIVELEKFFALPTVDPTRENTLKADEIITEIIVPPPPRAARSIYLEVCEKQQDWPLVSVAVVAAPVVKPGARIDEVRVVMGAVAPIPWRAHEAEAALRGKVFDRKLADAAAASALNNAQPLSENAYKVPMAKVIVRRALLAAAGIEAA